MRKKKAFDCVQMKWDIQRKQREEFAGVSEAERRRIQMQRLAADPILGEFLQQAQQASSSSLRR